MFIRHAWYVAALASEIKHEMLPRTLLGEKVVFYRTSQGKVTALQDRCVHRHVPLSIGRLKGDVVECGYHGMRFDAAGKCIHIPSQKQIPEKACVRAFPIVEKYGFVWIWMGPPQAADEAAIPDHELCDDPMLTGEMKYFFARCDYRLAVDNIMDFSHIAFVHETTVGSQAVVETEPKFTITGNEISARRFVPMEPTSPLLKKILKLEHVDRTLDVTYAPVANAKVNTSATPPGKTSPVLRVHTITIFTPESETTTHLWVGTYRNFALDSPELTRTITKEIITTVEQDIAITEAQQQNMCPDAFSVSLAGDRGPSAARQILKRLLRLESSQHGAHVGASSEPFDEKTHADGGLEVASAE